MHMIIVWALSWWYGSGWLQCLHWLREKLAASYDYFSFDMLIRTLFSPYKQISAGSVRGPIAVQFRAFVDRLFSRCIGAVVRVILILSGVIWMTVQAIGGTLLVVAWGFVPFLPLLGFVMMLSGWVPQWR